jgi:hypothetical protein
LRAPLVEDDASLATNESSSLALKHERYPLDLLADGRQVLVVPEFKQAHYHGNSAASVMHLSLR